MDERGRRHMHVEEVAAHSARRNPWGTRERACSAGAQTDGDVLQEQEGGLEGAAERVQCKSGAHCWPATVAAPGHSRLALRRRSGGRRKESKEKPRAPGHGKARGAGQPLIISSRRARRRRRQTATPQGPRARARPCPLPWQPRSAS